MRVTKNKILADSTKICNKCGLKKPLSSYYRNSRKLDGYENTCKRCQGKKYVKAKSYKDKKYEELYKANTKLCKKCGEYKSLCSFSPRKGTFDGLSWYCNDCTSCTLDMNKGKTLAKYHDLSDGERKYRNICGSSSRRKIPFNICKSEFLAWYSSTSNTCHYCGIDDLAYSGIMVSGQLDSNLSKIANQVGYSHRLTVDRIDNTKGYTIDNICKCCWFCNVTKGSILGEDIMIKSVGPYIRKRVYKQ